MVYDSRLALGGQDYFEDQKVIKDNVNHFEPFCLILNASVFAISLVSIQPYYDIYGQ